MRILKNFFIFYYNFNRIIYPRLTIGKIADSPTWIETNCVYVIPKFAVWIVNWYKRFVKYNKDPELIIKFPIESNEYTAI